MGNLLWYTQGPRPFIGLKNLTSEWVIYYTVSSFICPLKRYFCNVMRKWPKDVVTFVDAEWHSREDVKKALTFAEYKKAQTTTAAKVEQMCQGVAKGQNLASDFNVESGELATMFVPGPFAIAHHLISSWANQEPSNGVEARKQATGSQSNL